MIVAEIKNTNSTVRIHDEFCNAVSQNCISQLNKIVSDSYKRRLLSANENLKYIGGKMPKS